MTNVTFAYGFLFAVFVAAAAAPAFIYFCERFIELDVPDKRKKPGFIAGAFERTFAFFLVAFSGGENGLSLGDASTILLAWIAAKLAINWHRGPYKEWENERDWRDRAFIGLMAGVLSVSFGVVGGLIARGSIPLPSWLL